MIKRIPCRVVRTKPVGRSSNTLCHARRSNHFHHKIGEVNPQCKSTNDTVIYTRTLEITSISMDNNLAGEILDCYV
jgi:Zn finger protein HypA/HybF involved in hydrogenase expression